MWLAVCCLGHCRQSSGGAAVVCRCAIYGTIDKCPWATEGIKANWQGNMRVIRLQSYRPKWCDLKVICLQASDSHGSAESPNLDV